ncbi:helix-turn-helix transcriptional regulator [Bradyrhizobium jicamae]|uniref:helix-turn-helix transcriptional regulator n=1 Tax=Bradyrhizobium jicamae TaxID=280332 RepID=UPI001BAC3448|nr:transcriptional regulator [Bradyrhizobium jicamae]MBR0939272.1 helix-turn-helix domain-containing protein [Bradyrhizobium jicamae]
MFENRIKEFRQAKGLTQRQLAEAAETSQQQIQRIEAGNQLARFDLAARISAALGQPVTKVFPSAEPALARLKRDFATHDDEEASKEMEMAGLDVEPNVWTVKFRLRGGAEGDFSISGPDKHRLNRILHDQGDSGFVVLPSIDRQYALNLKHLTFCQLLFDGPSPEYAPPSERSYEVQFYLTDQRDPLVFEAEPDTRLLEHEEDPEPLSVQLQDLFYYAEMGVDDRRLSFVDLDGETAFFRPDDVSMFSVPIWLIEPNVSDDAEDETGGDKDG